MGLIERLKQRRHEHAIAKHKKAIKNKYGQGEDRQKAIEFFSKLGGQDGYEGLLERFMVNVEPSIRDEEEKQQVYEILVGCGADVIPAIEKYINRRDSATVPITWPLKVLDAVATTDQAVKVIVAALRKMGTEYVREPERKVLLVAQLAEYDHPDVVPNLIPFLQDHRDEVRLEALSALVNKADEQAREPMLQLLVDEDTPVRLRAAVAEALMKLGWTVKGYRKKVEAVLPEGLSVDRGGHIRGRWKFAPQQQEEAGIG
ncbi:MAG: HEAT repeat domain-containing protein [Deltaproteobacteria bacterium]|nr:MAG: HEAT repeat domain-containing protein [Deltaproteobacteria bacterium]